MALVLTEEQIKQGWVIWEAPSGPWNVQPIADGNMVEVIWSDGFHDQTQKAKTVETYCWHTINPKTTIGAYRVVIV